MYQVRLGRLVAERTQPLQQFRRICMIAKLFQSCDLGSNRYKVAEDFDFRNLVFDQEAARSRRLESDEQDQVPRVRQALSEMMQDAATRRHAARRDDDGWHKRRVDLLRFLCRRCEGES